MALREAGRQKQDASSIAAPQKNAQQNNVRLLKKYYLGLVVDDKGAAALHVTAVPHLTLAGADLLGVLHLETQTAKNKRSDV